MDHIRGTPVAIPDSMVDIRNSKCAVAAAAHFFEAFYEACELQPKNKQIIASIDAGIRVVLLVTDTPEDVDTRGLLTSIKPENASVWSMCSMTI